jgi:hypothetical protein
MCVLVCVCVCLAVSEKNMVCGWSWRKKPRIDDDTLKEWMQLVMCEISHSIEQTRIDHNFLHLSFSPCQSHFPHHHETKCKVKAVHFCSTIPNEGKDQAVLFYYFNIPKPNPIHTCLLCTQKHSLFIILLILVACHLFMSLCIVVSNTRKYGLDKKLDLSVCWEITSW